MMSLKLIISFVCVQLLVSTFLLVCEPIKRPFIKQYTASRLLAIAASSLKQNFATEHLCVHFLFRYGCTSIERFSVLEYRLFSAIHYVGSNYIGRGGSLILSTRRKAWLLVQDIFFFSNNANLLSSDSLVTGLGLSSLSLVVMACG